MQKIKIARFDQMMQSDYIKKVNELLGDKKRKYFVETYGCQMNVRDSETLSGLFELMGYEHTENMLEADAVIFNTCCVREGAEDRLTGNLGRLLPLKESNPDMLIMICGCMMQEEGKAEYIKKRFKFVDVVFGTSRAQELPRLMFSALSDRSREFFVADATADIVEDMPVKRESSFQAWVNIMYGCNNFCSYCIVPYVRGRERSRASADIIAECTRLAQNGIKEICLLGQNVNSYGLDGDEISFPELLSKLNEISGLERIRFMTSHPKDLSDELIAVMKNCKKVCPYIHLPVQSGSNEVLKRMNRKYTREKYIALVEKLKAQIPDIAISTDIIVGFPGETDQDFEDTLDLYRKVCFNSAFTFIYSPRVGTPAAKMEDQIPDKISKERITRLIKLAEECTYKANEKYLNNTYPVLVEGYSRRDENMLSGRTPHGRMVSFLSDKDLVGKTVNVKITKIKLNTFVGELED